jgi:hypothetical protein
MNTTTTRWTGLLFASALAVGCTSPNPESVNAGSLEAAALITATGARPMSQVAVHREGAIEPGGSDVAIAVRDSKLRLRTSSNHPNDAILEQLYLQLADADFPPSAQLPDGLKVRAQTLTSTEPVHAQVIARDADSLVVRVAGRLRYGASLRLPDDTLYPLGSSWIEGSDLELHVARDAAGAVTVTAVAPPQRDCGAMGALLTLSSCTLYVETDGEIAPATN